MCGMTSSPRIPTAGEYLEAIQHPDICFSDPELRSASFERMAMGLPRVISGNFACVFPMTSPAGRRYAVKCFTRGTPNQLQRYRIIGDYLRRVRPWWATDFQFIADGIQVGHGTYPILRMNWVEGLTLTGWITKHIGNSSVIERLAQRFDELMQTMLSAHMAHGDLQHGNLLVDDTGSLHLVDYDGMYVPGLDFLATDEVGHPNYQPPGRTQSDYGPTMDRFSGWLISLSLQALAADPDLWDRLNPDHEEYLLLNKRDFVSPSNSESISVLASHPDTGVRELALRVRHMLQVPIAAIPEPVRATNKPEGRQQTSHKHDSKNTDGVPGGIPSWMASHLKQPATAPIQTGASPARNGRQGTYSPPIRSRRWCLRVVMVLPLIMLAIVIDSPVIGVASSLGMGICGTIILVVFYLRGSLSRDISEVRHGRRLANISIRDNKRLVARTRKQALKIEREKKKLAHRQTRKQNSIQAFYARRLREVRQPQESIDLKLKRLDDRKKREQARRLQELQQEHVRSRLSASAIAASHIPGIGAQLVANLQSAGIRTAADFKGVRYLSGGGRTTIAQFQLTNGRFVRVSGIGEVKARRVDHWRQGQLTYALQGQPIALSPSEITSVQTRFAAEERQLRDERTRVVDEIARRAAAIEREFADAVAVLNKEQASERSPVEQRAADNAIKLSNAIGDQLRIEQSFQDLSDQMTDIPRPPFRSFMASVLRG
jgi:hypothetical protein